MRRREGEEREGERGPTVNSTRWGPRLSLRTLSHNLVISTMSHIIKHNICSPFHFQDAGTYILLARYDLAILCISVVNHIIYGLCIGFSSPVYKPCSSGVFLAFLDRLDGTFSQYLHVYINSHSYDSYSLRIPLNAVSILSLFLFLLPLSSVL